MSLSEPIAKRPEQAQGLLLRYEFIGMPAACLCFVFRDKRNLLKETF